MNVDHYITIGTDHQAQGRPCEDYALSGTLPDGAVFGVVADGCSGANANTDVGARALAWAFQQTVTDMRADGAALFDEAFHAKLLESFAKHRYMGSPRDYLATIVGFVATLDEAAVYVQGDGALALCYADGSLRFINFQWGDNMPYYLGYQLHPHMVAAFEEQVGANSGTHPFGQSISHVPGTSASLVDQIADQTRLESFTVDQVRNGHVLRFNPRKEGIVALAVMTDGVAQVGQLPAVMVAQTFTAFKNNQGEFVKRRLMKALKEYKRDSTVPRDDVGLAAVWFGYPPAPAPSPQAVATLVASSNAGGADKAGV